MDLGMLHTETAHVDAVQSQHRKCARKTARGPPPVVGERLAQPERFGEAPAGEIAPVVEVARDQERRAPRHQALEPLDQRADLVAPAALVQRKVQADAVQRLAEFRNPDLAMQEAAPLAARNAGSDSG